MRSGTYVIYRSEDFYGSDSAYVRDEPRGDDPHGGDLHDGDLHDGGDNIAVTGENMTGVSSKADDHKSNVDRTRMNVTSTGDGTAGREFLPGTILARTVRKVLQDYEDRILVQSPGRGCHELREEIRDYLARSRGFDVRTKQIVIGSGAEYLYGMIVQMLGRNRIFALEDPSYKKILQVYKAMGAKCELLAMGRSGIRGDALKKSGASVLHVTPYNSYPSGITADISKKLEYINWAAGRNGIIIEDNYDSELSVMRKPEEAIFTMTDEVKVIYINTFSKTIAPSVRVGYMIMPECLVDDFEEKLGFYACTVPVLDQLVLAELIRCGDFERHINRVRRRRRAALKEM
ncbi:MAG: PLP-dependent aminotransferase family protein [Lachnospiraceae bacterium]|nr:PLP-dependent aminotransferase family protein [Lachnospiraceae bacterium]